MSIGLFSLLTKLVRDPITHLVAGDGVPEGDNDVATIRAVLGLAESIVHANCAAQIKAGARAIFLCEPAANRVYFSPRQIRKGTSVYDKFVTEPNLRLKQLLDDNSVDLLFHDCGEVIPEMVTSLGSSIQTHQPWEPSQAMGSREIHCKGCCHFRQSADPEVLFGR